MPGKANEALFRLYGSCFPDYPVPKGLFARFLEDARVIRVHDVSGVAGFCAFRGNVIKLLCVRDGGKGRGGGLLERSEEHIRSGGHAKIILGGAENEIFQGVPEDYGARGFFEKRGYRAEQTSVNMRLSLEGFDYGVLDIPKTPDGVVFRFVSKSRRRELYAAVEAVNGDWLAFFEGTGEPVMAAFSDGRLVGFQIISPDGARFADSDCSIGCVGVTREARGKGIGLRMVAEGAAWLKKRRRKFVELLYVELEGWYGKLGFKTASRQWMGEKRLSP
jgi:GNAT superfamily N-acetyltransferase